MPSYDNSKRKIEKIWNETKKNKSEINDLKTITFDFNSINFNKRISKISLLSGEEFTSSDGGIICWVAKSIYGKWSDIRVHYARIYFTQIAPKCLLDFYIKYGERIANFIDKYPIFKVCLKPLFNYFSNKGKEYAILCRVKKLS